MSTETPKKAPTGLGWEVKEFRNGDGTLKDCFVAAPRSEDMAYGLEVLGDDYTGYGDVEGKFKHCQMIVAWAKAASPVSAEPVAYLDLGAGGYMDVGTDLTDEQLAALPKGRHMLAIVGTYGLEGFTESPVAAQADLNPAEPTALDLSIRELDEWEANGDVCVTPSIGESVMLVLHELKRLRAAQAQQPVSGANGLPVELSGVAQEIAGGSGFWRSCSGCHELNEGHNTGPQSKVFQCALGNGCSECGGIGAIWDTTDYDAMGDALAAGMAQPQPSRNAGELDELKAFEIELRRQCFQPPTHEARDLSWCMWQALAALAQQDAALRAEVLGMVRMLEANEWADHCGQTELGKRLEWAITALQNRPQNIPEIIPASSEQDADKVDAERWRALRAAATAKDNEFLNRVHGYLESTGLQYEDDPTEEQIDAAIDAARKEQA